MKKSVPFFISVGFFALALSGCGSKNPTENVEEEVAKKSFVEKQTVKVSTAAVRKAPFSRELVSNGKLSATRKAVVLFQVADQITEVRVSNGDRVAKGTLIAQIEPFVYKKRLEDAENQFEKARIDLEDQLLGYGFTLKDTATAPVNILKMCFIRSGYNQAKSNLKEAERNFSYTRVIAPISGVIANLEARVNNPTSGYKSCCEVIDDNSMKVEFPILEGEVSMVSRGQKVTLIPFAAPTRSFEGVITAVNPTVNASGVVMVQAGVNNPGGQLMDGMNVKVLAKNELPDCLIIPKSAVLYRQNRKVVFVNENNIAKWVYVEVGLENSTEVTITDNSLKEGDRVVISNNLNLAHETPIEVVK